MTDRRSPTPLSSMILLFGGHLTLLLAVGLGCVDAEGQLEVVIGAHRGCSQDSQCMVVGGSDCRCPVVVHQDGQAEVQAAMAALPCCDAFGSCVMVECAAFASIACEEGQCLGR